MFNTFNTNEMRGTRLRYGPSKRVCQSPIYRVIGFLLEQWQMSIREVAHVGKTTMRMTMR